MQLSPARLELRKAIEASTDEHGCAENLKAIVEAKCTLPVSKAYVYVREFKDMHITKSTKWGSPLRIKINKEQCL